MRLSTENVFDKHLIRFKLSLASAHTSSDLVNMLWVLPIHDMMTQIHYAKLRNRNESCTL